MEKKTTQPPVVTQKWDLTKKTEEEKAKEKKKGLPNDF